MWSLLQAAGWPAYLILVASLATMVIIVFCAFRLRRSEVCPSGLLKKVAGQYKDKGISPEMLTQLHGHSDLGKVFATALKNMRNKREVIKESIEETGRAVAHDLEFLVPTLGTIATVAPLLGLLGTVIGMIEIFGAQSGASANPAVLAHGISVALYNTAFGIIVAVPAMLAYRYFRARVDDLLIDMEQQAIKLVEIIQGDRKE